MKSYGWAPTLLAMTGYEQVRSVVAELAGDHEAAARIELHLPDTGVCAGAGLFDDPDGASAGGAAPRRRRWSRSALRPPAPERWQRSPGPARTVAVGPGGALSRRCVPRRSSLRRSAPAAPP
jgi:hypothetical protein